jgi:hypothetical protein
MVMSLTCAIASPAEIGVYLFLSPECPVSQRYRPEVERIAADYPSVRFHLTPPRSLIRQFGITVTPEAAVVDDRGRLRYRGRIDDQYAGYGKTRFAPTRRDLRLALDELLAGKPVTVRRTRAFGCAIAD